MKERFAQIIYAASIICSAIALTIPLLIAFSGEWEVFVVFSICGLLFALVFYAIGWSVRYIITGNKASFALEYLSKFRGKTYSIFVLANLPIYDFMQQTPPLDLAETSSDLTQDEDVNALVYSGIISYQLLIYLEYVRIRFGSEVSRLVEEQMYITLDRPTEGAAESVLGQTTKSFIEMGRKIIMSDPIEIDDETAGEKITLPTEFTLAACYLLKTKGSPYYRSGDADGEQIPDALNLNFANVLEKARIGVYERYSPIIFNKQVTLDKASTFGIHVEDSLNPVTTP